MIAYLIYNVSNMITFISFHRKARKRKVSFFTQNPWSGSAAAQRRRPAEGRRPAGGRPLRLMRRPAEGRRPRLEEKRSLKYNGSVFALAEKAASLGKCFPGNKTLRLNFNDNQNSNGNNHSNNNNKNISLPRIQQV